VPFENVMTENYSAAVVVISAIPFVSVFFAVISIIKSDFVDGSRVSLGGSLLVLAGSHLLVLALTFTERYTHFGLLGLCPS
jgi:hypothetical protein